MQKKKNAGLKVFMWLLALGWAAMLFVFSGQNGVQSGNLSRRFTEWVLRILPNLPWTVGQLEPVLRKIAHFAIFALEGMLLCIAMQLSFSSRRRATLLCALLCGCAAGANELHQSFVAGRNAAWTDVLIDSAGAVLGILAASLLLFLLRRIRQRRQARRRNVII